SENGMLPQRGMLAALRMASLRSLMRLVTLHWPFSWMRSRLDEINNNNINKSSLPSDSMIIWYLALETGNFWLHYWLLLIYHAMMLSLALSR
ncbi:hypothetical protein HN51_037221, partial [Arachis hypogaea]